MNVCESRADYNFNGMEYVYVIVVIHTIFIRGEGVCGDM